MSIYGHRNTFKGVSITNEFPRTHWECNERLRVKRWHWKHNAQVTSRGHFLLKPAIFALILSNAMTEDFITASFQTYDQNRMNEMNKTENEAENNEWNRKQSDRGKWIKKWITL